MLDEWPYQKTFLASYIALYQAKYGRWVTPPKDVSGFIHRTLSSQVWSMSDPTKRRFWLHTSHSIKPSMVDEWPHQKTILASWLTLFDRQIWLMSDPTKRRFWLHASHSMTAKYGRWVTPPKDDSGFVSHTLWPPSVVDEWPHQKTILASYITLYKAKFFCNDEETKKFSKSKIFTTYIYSTQLFSKNFLFIYILYNFL
jgi:hypothetical protein